VKNEKEWSRDRRRNEEKKKKKEKEEEEEEEVNIMKKRDTLCRWSYRVR